MRGGMLIPALLDEAGPEQHFSRHSIRTGTGQCKLPIQGDEMTFTIIEQFEGNDMLPMYRHVRDEGRMMPDGLKVGDSWLEPNFSRCFQLMECDDRRLHQE
jgi:hypothetical protein